MCKGGGIKKKVEDTLSIIGISAVKYQRCSCRTRPRTELKDIPLLFPDADKVRKIVRSYKEDTYRPEAYTMDIAVIRQKDQSADTVILEVYPFVSCGLYGFNHPQIPDMLEAGVRYYSKSIHGQ